MAAAAPGCAAVVVRWHAQLRFGQIADGRGGDAVAADVQVRAQRGEVACTVR